MNDNNSNEQSNDEKFEKYTEVNQFLFDQMNKCQIALTSLIKDKTVQEELFEIKTNELEVLVANRDSNKGLFTPNYNQGKISELEKELSLSILRLSELNNDINNTKKELNNLLGISQYISECYNDKVKKKLKKTVYSEMGIRILKAQEDERQRIASDIHDTTVQNLTYLIHKTELCIKLLEIDQIRAKLELTSMTSTIKSVINDMRDIIYDLKPMSLEDLGFIVTLERYINQMMISHDIHIKLNCKQQIEENLPLVKLALFRVIQEACWNAIKHANASQIDIDVEIDNKDRIIFVEIKDNGNGFNIMEYQSKALERNTGFGLSIMKERVGLLSGKIDIQSSEGKGTIINISIPIITCKEEKDE